MHELREIRRAIAAALVVPMLVAALVALPAAASSSRHSVAPSATQTRAGTVHLSSVVPWTEVGPGWLLATWLSAGDEFLVLVSPDGVRYVLQQVPFYTELESWPAGATRALLVRPDANGRTQHVWVLDLRSGATLDSFRVAQSGFLNARLTLPWGLAVYLLRDHRGGAVLSRTSLDNARQVTYPGTFSKVGKFDATFLSTTDGTELVFGAQHGLAIVSNTGALVAQLRFAGSANCSPTRWWAPSVILAACGSPTHLFEVPLDGTAPIELTRSPVAPDQADLNAWQIGSTVYVESLLRTPTCDWEAAQTLHGSTPRRIQIPGVPIRHGDAGIVGATSTSLVIQTDAACAPNAQSARILYFSPATDSSMIVLGPHANGGGVIGALLYGQGW